MKTGIIDVGGGFRDIYGAGVLDACTKRKERCRTHRSLPAIIIRPPLPSIPHGAAKGPHASRTGRGGSFLLLMETGHQREVIRKKAARERSAT